MGRDGCVPILGFVTLLSQALCIIGCALPLHKLTFFTMGIIPVFRMYTSTMHVDFPDGANDLCKIIVKVTGSDSLKWCFKLNGSHSLQDTSSIVCSPLAQRLWPTLCQGLSSAHMLGLALIIMVGINLIMSLVAIGLLALDPKRKPVATGLGVGGCFLTLSVIIAYFAMVNMNLDNAAGEASLLSFLLSTGRHAITVGEGMFMIGVGLLLQMISVGMMMCCIMADEDDDDIDPFAYKESSAQNYDNYGSAQKAPSPAPSQAGYPPMQQQQHQHQPMMQPMMQQQPMMQPMMQPGFGGPPPLMTHGHGGEFGGPPQGGFGGGLQPAPVAFGGPQPPVEVQQGGPSF